MTDKIKHAFARSSFAHEYGGDCEAQDGMTERDYMALKIMCALLSNPNRISMYDKRESAAKDAYAFADALIAFRKSEVE